jgi:phage baseplate assembly protein W
MEEVVTLGADRRTLNTRQPVANSGTVRVLVNDEMFVPQSGLFSSAQLYGTMSGPFDLIENEDVLNVTTPAGTSSVSLGIHGTARLTADEILKKLQRANFSVAEVSNYNGHLVFADTVAVGPDSFVTVSGSAAGSLGFGVAGVNSYQRNALGVQLYPGWRLYKRPDEITNRYPKFDYPVKGNPIFKVTYTVPGHRCLRCGGAYIENDYRFTVDGQALMIQDENLLYQASLKMLLTNKGSNPYHPWYGADIKTRIGTKAVSGVAALLNEDVRRALTRFQTLQGEQSKFQQVSFKERLYSILQVEVLPHAQDPTTFQVNVTIQNASSQPIDLSIVFTVPNVVALMGSNGLLLGPDAVQLQAQNQIPGLLRS